MRETKITCDICGIDIKNANNGDVRDYSVPVNYIERNEYEGTRNKIIKSMTIDLCRDCFNKSVIINVEPYQMGRGYTVKWRNDDER